MKKILGLMSGSSLDGLDLAVCQFSPKGKSYTYKLLFTKTVQYNEQLKGVLKVDDQLSARDLKLLDYSLANVWSEIMLSLDGFDIDEIDLIASHGHTLLHEPHNGITIQIGNGGVISALTKKPVVSDFRIQDVALGGQGTPLVPIAEQLLFAGYDAYLNLGGIANISFVFPQMKAFDVSPCNQMLNHLAKLKGMDFDRDGALSRMGKLNRGLYEHLMALEYFNLEGSKSLDNQWIQTEVIPKLMLGSSTIEDRLFTVSKVIVDQIKKAIQSQNLHTSYRVFVTGGGAHNMFFIELLEKSLKEISVTLVLPPKEIIDFKESILMAFLGYLRINGKVNTLSSVTGAHCNTMGGAIYDVHANLEYD